MKTKKLKQLAKILSTVKKICIIGIFIGLFCCVGTAGTYDYADETNTVLSAEEEHEAFKIGIIGIIIAGCSFGISAGCENLEFKIYDIIEERRERMLQKRADERKRQAEQKAQLMAFMKSTPTLLQAKAK